MQKWEYCEVDAVFPNEVIVRIYDPTGSIIKEQHKTRNAEAAREKAKQIVAKLGLECWEMVNARENGMEFWLKRPKQELSAPDTIQPPK